MSLNYATLEYLPGDFAVWVPYLSGESILFHAFVQLLSRVQLFVTPWAAACQASLPFTISWSLL